MRFSETNFDDFGISKITKKAIKKNGVNEPILINAAIQDSDLELLFEVESTAEEHHKVDLKGNTKDSSRGYAVVVRFVKANQILFEHKINSKNRLVEYTVDESIRNEILERLPSVLVDFKLDKNEKLIDKIPGCLEGKKDTWEDKLQRVFKSFGIQKCDDIIKAILGETINKKISKQELVTKLYKVFKDCDVKVHCDCPAFYYQGMQQDDDTNGNARYKFQGTSGSHAWTLIHSDAGGKTGKALCKHLNAVRAWLKIKQNVEKVADKLEEK